MKKKSSERRLIENELLLRDANEKAEVAIEKTFDPQEQKELRVEFYCECSDLSCQERIPLTVNEYKQLHRRRDHFIIVKGHQSTKIEKIVEEKTRWSIVEKFALQAA